MGIAASLLGVLPVATAAEGPGVKILRHVPCNLFTPQEAVRFQVKLNGFVPEQGDLAVTVSDYYGKTVWQKTYPVELGAKLSEPLAVDIGPLGRGYYSLKAAATAHPKEGETAAPAIESTATFGVMGFVQRTADDVRQHYRFGLKWWGGVHYQREDLEAMTKLGLQWTRIIMNEGVTTKPGQKPGERVTAKEMLTDYPMNAVIKIERFPKELYDEQRYGPLEDWEKKYGKGAWTLKTLPKKEAYQAWLREQLASIPADQKIFEIWNEPWDKMSPEDFATLSQWVAEVVLKDRPDAILGPNLLGNTSPYEYDGRVIAAGGLKGMKMVALHPYAASENREFLRDYKGWLKQKTGRDMDIYVTEFGSHSTPAGPARRSEQEQARRVVRQSLSLYAEDIKALIPHWLGQTEQSPTYIEDWFGFLRKNEQPKPVLLAYANLARLIDGSTYVGDLWYGPKVGAMLFRDKEKYTLALWTLGDPRDADTHPPDKVVEVNVGVPEVTQVDIVGAEKKLTTNDSKLSLHLNEAPVYLMGVSPALGKQASVELRPDRWPKPAKPLRISRTARKLVPAPALNGSFKDWTGATELALLNPKVAGADCSGVGYLAWDDQFLYIGADIRDNEILNTEPRAKLYLQDCVELFVSTEVREKGSGFGPHDHQYFAAPASGEGKAVLGEVTNREAGQVTDIPGVKYFAGKTEKGWAIQCAIPWKSMRDFKAAKGAKIAFNMRVNDADTSHTRFKIDPADQSEVSHTDPSTWPVVVLAD